MTVPPAATGPEPVEVTRSFRAMNTDVLGIVVASVSGPSEVAAGAALVEVERWFATVEACASRFRPESELSALNRSAGQPFAASALLFELIEAALQAAEQTAGAFDPTLLDALERASYDRSFEQIAQQASVTSPAGAPPPVSPAPRTPTPEAPRPEARPPEVEPALSWRDMRLDRAARTITLPAGCRIDLGGIGKGWTVDRACALLRTRGFGDFAVDAGGDLYAAGRAADGEPWSVGVSDPAHPERDAAVLTLDRNAVATSTTAKRRWQAGGEVRHHLIDPRTRRPAASGVASVSVVAESVTRAETLAKAALVLGPGAGRALLRAQGVAGLLILDDGTLLHEGPAVFRLPE